MDPFLAILNNMWKRLSYQIYCDSSADGMDASRKFTEYKERHFAAAVIQRNFRNHLRRKKCTLVTHGKEEENLQDIFKGQVFVLSGVIPAIDGRRLSRPGLTEMILHNGGRVRKKIPSGSKKSCKSYIVLSGPLSNKIPSTVRDCERFGHLLLQYSFITDSIKQGLMVDKEAYKIGYSSKWKVQKANTLEDKHFRRRKRMITIIKKAKRTLRVSPKVLKIPRAARNVAVFYAQNKRKAVSSKRRLTFGESTKVYCDLLKEWTTLPFDQKEEVTKEYKACIERLEQMREQRAQHQTELLRKNTVTEPAYAKQFK